MLTYLLLFAALGAALSLLVWSGSGLMESSEDPLGDRLEELQSLALVSSQRTARRTLGGRGLDRVLSIVDLLGIVLGTGLALDQAMMRVSEEMQYIYPDLANEFTTVVMQVRAGQERTVAFNQFVKRTGIEDIKSLAAMIVQSEKFGTSLAQALKVYAEALRTRRRLRAEAAVGKAGIKMLFPIVLFILPVLFVITLVPGMLSVLANLKLLGTRP